MAHRDSNVRSFQWPQTCLFSTFLTFKSIFIHSSLFDSIRITCPSIHPNKNDKWDGLKFMSFLPMKAFFFSSKANIFLWIQIIYVRCNKNILSQIFEWKLKAFQAQKRNKLDEIYATFTLEIWVLWCTVSLLHCC